MTFIRISNRLAIIGIIIAKTAKIGQKVIKIANLKVDALPHSLTDSTHTYRLYYPSIPLANAGNKKILACN